MLQERLRRAQMVCINRQVGSEKVTTMASRATWNEVTRGRRAGYLGRDAHLREAAGGGGQDHGRRAFAGQPGDQGNPWPATGELVGWRWR